MMDIKPDIDALLVADELTAFEAYRLERKMNEINAMVDLFGGDDETALADKIDARLKQHYGEIS